MLLKYGDTIVGMDATYKVTQWTEQPFFLISVVTNHGHAFPVAMFFCENETGAAIAAALKHLRAWNPDWQPTYIMVDKDAKVRDIMRQPASLLPFYLFSDLSFLSPLLPPPRPDAHLTLGPMCRRRTLSTRSSTTVAPRSCCATST
jgi:hypothetical protein